MMKSHSHIQKLVDLFDKKHPREAHAAATMIMHEMAIDRSFMIEMVKQNLLDPSFLRRTRHYPTLSMKIFENANFNLVANLWPVLPEGARTRSHQSLHHHGKLLLTTAAAFGPGYETIIFDSDFETNPRTGETRMAVDQIAHHRFGEVDFVDSYQPHIVFYPNDFSMTYALWSKDRKSSVDALKKVEWVRRLKTPLMKVIQSMGLSEIANLNVLEYFDFYPDNGKLYVLKDRFSYENGTNENFIQNIFWILQKISFEDANFIRDLLSNNAITKSAQPFIKKFLENEEILPKFEPSHLFVPRVTQFKEDVLAVVYQPNGSLRTALSV